MKWTNHYLCTFSGIYALSGSPLLGLGVSTFSHLPDIVEYGLGKLVFKEHRGTSHSPLLWLGVLVLSFPFSYTPLIQNAAAVAGSYGFEPWWVLLPGLGAYCHLVEDALSKSGIPLWNKMRIAAGFYRTGTAQEYLVSLTLAGICLAFVVWKSRLLS